jgi:hypothetical protein
MSDITDPTPRRWYHNNALIGGTVLSALAVGLILSVVVVGAATIAAGGGLAWLNYAGTTPPVANATPIEQPAAAPVAKAQPLPVPRDLSKVVFNCDISSKTPIYPEGSGEIDAKTAAALREELGYAENQPLVGYRFRLPNPNSAMGQWAMMRGELESDSWAEEVHLIGVTPTALCLDNEGRKQSELVAQADGTCHSRSGKVSALGSKVVTVCMTPEGHAVTYGDLYTQLNRDWAASNHLGTKVWAHCDQEGRRPDPKGSAQFPGACRRAGDLEPVQVASR